MDCWFDGSTSKWIVGSLDPWPAGSIVGWFAECVEDLIDRWLVGLLACEYSRLSFAPATTCEK